LGPSTHLGFHRCRGPAHGVLALHPHADRSRRRARHRRLSPPAIPRARRPGPPRRARNAGARAVVRPAVLRAVCAQAAEGAFAIMNPSTGPSSSYSICTLPGSGSWLLSEGLEKTGIAGRPREYFEPKLFSGEPVPDYEAALETIFRKGTTSNGVF